MRTNITKKPIWRMLTAVLLFMLFMSVPVEVEAAKGITAKKKTLSVGQEYKLKIKGLSTKEKKAEGKYRGKYRIRVWLYLRERGSVCLVMDPSVLDEVGNATVTAKLENGTKLKAELYGYSEQGIVVKQVIEDFKKNYITSYMAQFEKMETIAKYVEHNYVLYQSDWRYMVISGGGDCFSSRYFVKYLCESVGMKSLSCIGEDYHQNTLVQNETYARRRYEQKRSKKDNQGYCEKRREN